MAVVSSPFYRQVFVSLSPHLAAVSVGASVSFPTVLLHQLNRNDTNIHLDFETSTWIGSIHGVAGLPSILMPTLMQLKGRKFAFITACLAFITGWVIAYLAESATTLLIAESFHGFGSNSIYAVTCLSITEMVAPDYRQTSIQMYYMLEILGIIANGFLTQFLHWKIICLIMGAPSVLGLILACMWPESPYWLAYKRRFTKCEQAFTWLRGNDNVTIKELNDLINTNRAAGNVKKEPMNKFWNKLNNRDFYLPCLHIFVLEYILQGMGCIIILIYSMDIVIEVTNSTKLGSYGSVIVNTIFLTGFILSIIIKKLNSKKALMFSILFSVIFSMLLSIVSYTQYLDLISKDSYISFILLICYVFSTSLGIMNNVYPIASTLMPIKYRGIGGVFYVTNTCLLHSIALKSAPYLLKYTKISGMFTVFCINGIICGLFLWKYLPNIEGKTLSEIEHYYKYGEFEMVNDNVKEMLVIENIEFVEDSIN